MAAKQQLLAINESPCRYSSDWWQVTLFKVTSTQKIDVVYNLQISSGELNVLGGWMELITVDADKRRITGDLKGIMFIPSKIWSEKNTFQTNHSHSSNCCRWRLIITKIQLRCNNIRHPIIRTEIGEIKYLSSLECSMMQWHFASWGISNAIKKMSLILRVLIWQLEKFLITERGYNNKQ